MGQCAPAGVAIVAQKTAPSAMCSSQFALLDVATPKMTAVGFEPTPLRTADLSKRLGPLGQTVFVPIEREKVNAEAATDRILRCDVRTAMH